MSGEPTALKSPSKRARRRDVIREEAARIFAQLGYHVASVQDLAEALNSTKAAIYYYYASKEDILFDIMTFADEQVTPILDRSVECPGSALERVGRLVQSHVTWYLQHPNIAKVAFRDWNALTGDALRIQIERRRRYSRILRDAIDRCREAGLMAYDVRTLLVANFINGAVATSNVWFNPRGPDTPERVGRAFGEMAMAVVAGGAFNQSPSADLPK